MSDKNYASSHESFTVSAKRFEKSPFMDCYDKAKTTFGISANRFYPLSIGDDPIKKYWNLKKNVMLYDVPEKPLEIVGPDAVTLLEEVFSRKIFDLKILCARYALACTHNGGILMDGVLIRLSEEKFWYIHANGDFKNWLLAHSKKLNVKIRDPKSWVIQVQGPNSLKVLKSAVSNLSLENFKYFRAQTLNFNGQDFLVSRTGWTGELGFEVYTNSPNDDHQDRWNFIMEKGKKYGIDYGGLDSMGIRRIEAGILDYGTDMTQENTPFELGLGKFIDLEKESFIGRDFLINADKTTRLYGIKCKEAVPFPDLEVVYNSEVVGRTTVGAFSPLLNTGIGYVLFNRHHNWQGKTLDLRDQDKNLYDCTITNLPFYDKKKMIPRS